VESYGAGRGLRRRFRCAWSGRDAEVEFIVRVRGLPGPGPIVGVRTCSAWDPPTAIECQRRCLDPAFRRQWEPARPVHGRRG